MSTCRFPLPFPSPFRRSGALALIALIAICLLFVSPLQQQHHNAAVSQRFFSQQVQAEAANQNSQADSQQESASARGLESSHLSVQMEPRDEVRRATESKASNHSPSQPNQEYITHSFVSAQNEAKEELDRESNQDEKSDQTPKQQQQEAEAEAKQDDQHSAIHQMQQSKQNQQQIKQEDETQQQQEQQQQITASPEAPPTRSSHTARPLVKGEPPIKFASKHEAQEFARQRFPHLFSQNGQGPELPQDSASPADKAAAIRREFLHAYNGFESYAFGQDDYHPIRGEGENSYRMLLTQVDSLDTMLLMGCEEEYEFARAHIVKYLQFGKQEDINLFETTIRVMGGLLGAHTLTQDPEWVRLATELADQLMPAFNTPTGLPYGTVCMESRRYYNPSWIGECSSIAELGTLQLEFAHLSHLTGNAKYQETAVDGVMSYLDAKHKSLYNMWIDPLSGEFKDDGVISLGSRADSLYEYFVKLSVQSSRTDARAKRMYDRSIQAILDELLQNESAKDCEDVDRASFDPNCRLKWFAERHSGQLSGKFDHLVCFAPGMLALGVHHKVSNEPERHLRVAKQVVRTCMELYKQSPTGLAPEIAQFSLRDSSFSVDPNAKHSLLRPETVESLYVLWCVTGDSQYRDWAWSIFKSLVRWARIDGGGYSSLRDVQDTSRSAIDVRLDWSNSMDNQESFFLSETMKYLYLIFVSPHEHKVHHHITEQSHDKPLSPEQRPKLNLIDFVFNTEAHALPRHRRTRLQQQQQQQQQQQSQTEPQLEAKPQQQSSPKLDESQQN